MIAGGGVEHRARADLGISDLERALLDAVGQNIRDLADQALLVRLDRLAGFACQRQIGLEHLGIFGDFLVLDREHRAQPLLEPGRRRSRRFLPCSGQRANGAIPYQTGHARGRRSSRRTDPGLVMRACMALLE